MTSARSSPTPAPLKPPAPSPSASSPSPVSTASSPAPAEPSSGSRSVASCPGSPSPTSLSPATRASTAAAASVQVISVRSARSLLRSAATRDLRMLDEIPEPRLHQTHPALNQLVTAYQVFDLWPQRATVLIQAAVLKAEHVHAADAPQNAPTIGAQRRAACGCQ
uniref:Uncharacterized protein n=1 Tax=Ananas comosus var. bracteatus TaxID=296719 RepID=A0A6V7QCI3_ANACO|nr:unnamed protein product [Ananas comosus var. bracteatus]